MGVNVRQDGCVSSTQYDLLLRTIYLSLKKKCQVPFFFLNLQNLTNLTRCSLLAKNETNPCSSF